MLEVTEDCTGLRSTLVAGQLPVDKWHPSMADPTQADRPCSTGCGRPLTTPASGAILCASASPVQPEHDCPSLLAARSHDRAT